MMMFLAAQGVVNGAILPLQRNINGLIFIFIRYHDCRGSCDGQSARLSVVFTPKLPWYYLPRNEAKSA